MNLKFEGNQVTFFKLNQQYFFTVICHKLKISDGDQPCIQILKTYYETNKSNRAMYQYICVHIVYNAEVI